MVGESRGPRDEGRVSEPERAFDIWAGAVNYTLACFLIAVFLGLATVPFLRDGDNEPQRHRGTERGKTVKRNFRTEVYGE